MTPRQDVPDSNMEFRNITIAIPRTFKKLTMANSQPIHSASADVDLEKGEETGDGSSTLTSSSSTQQNEHLEAGLHALSTSAKEYIGVYPNGANGLLVENNEVARTSTRASWRDVARAITRISTKSSWKDPGPPPDGGISGWTQVLMGHLVIMNTWLVCLGTGHESLEDF